jgi:hypothetical protein
MNRRRRAGRPLSASGRNLGRLGVAGERPAAPWPARAVAWLASRPARVVNAQARRRAGFSGMAPAAPGEGIRCGADLSLSLVPERR